MKKKSNKLKLLWPYRYSDITTWKYLDFFVRKNKYTDEQEIVWIKNPIFQFNKLDV